MSIIEYHRIYYFFLYNSIFNNNFMLIEIYLTFLMKKEIDRKNLVLMNTFKVIHVNLIITIYSKYYKQQHWIFD